MSASLVERRTSPLGQQFIKNRLADGHTLARAALKLLPITQGSTTTLLPRSVALKTLEDFDIGGKLPTPGISEWKGLQNDNEALLMIPVPTTDSWLAGQIRDYLLGGEDRVCVIEDALKRSTDAVLRDVPTSLASYDHEVYHLLFPEDSQDKRILATLKFAKAVPIFIGALTRWSGEWPKLKRGILSFDQIQALAAATQKLFVGVYDGEGYLIWTR